MIKNVNTIEEYKNFDKAMLLQQAGRTVSAIFRTPGLMLNG